MTPPVDIRPPARQPTRAAGPKRRVGSVVLVTVLLVAGLGLMSVAFDDPARVDRLQIDNPSEFDIGVDVRAVNDPSRVLVGRAVQQCSTSFHEIVDQGTTWTIHFSAQGRDAGEVTVDRAQLEGDGWIYRIPADVIDALRTAGTPPPPLQRCAAP